MLIRTEQTPNPATRKFLPERVHVFVEELKAWRSPFWTHD